MRRLQSHPAIALWGGNNENEIALTWFKQSTDNRDLYVVDYVELYINTVHRLVHRYVGVGVCGLRKWIVTRTRVHHHILYTHAYIQTHPSRPPTKHKPPHPPSLDPARAWVDSSPANGLLSEDPYVKRWGYPGDLHYGDLHHYVRFVFILFCVCTCVCV